jgi:hypothetical protein
LTERCRFFRPTGLPFTASRRRWWSMTRGRFPSCSLSTRISSSRYSMRTCWWWFIHLAGKTSSKGRDSCRDYPFSGRGRRAHYRQSAIGIDWKAHIAIPLFWASLEFSDSTPCQKGVQRYDAGQTQQVFRTNGPAFGGQPSALVLIELRAFS